MDKFNKIWIDIKRGSEKAFYTLYSLLFPGLLRYVQQIVKDLYLAEDIVQEAFIKIWENKDSIGITDSIQAYLYKLSHNLSINKLQHLRTAKNQVNTIISEAEWQFIKDTYQVNDYIVEHIEEWETDKLIRKAIGLLPEKCCQVFLLSRYENLTNEEIAQQLNISINTVRAHIYRALEEIRRELKIGN